MSKSSYKESWDADWLLERLNVTRGGVTLRGWTAPKNITAIYLLATPFWKGDEDWQKGFTLKSDFADQLPKNIPLHVYHNEDDEEVPFAQFKQYKNKITHATFHEGKAGGHQFNNNLAGVADDIKNLPAS